MEVSATEIYNDELREKHLLRKNYLTSKPSRSGKRFRFSYENMSKEAQKEYTKPSEMRVYSMYDTILEREKFDALPLEQQKVALEYWREKFTVKELAKGLSMSGQTVYNKMDELDIKRKKRGYKRSQKNETNQTVNVVTHVPEEQKQQPQPLPTGLNLIYNGHKTPEEINAILLSFASMLENQNGKFQIELKISEK